MRSGTILLSLILGVAAALGDVLGGLALTAKSRWDQVRLRYFIALGAGFMLAAAILEMLPESMRRSPQAPLFIIGGYLLVHLFEHTLPSHFHFGEETHAEAMVGSRSGTLALIGLLVHSFFDGVAIASGLAIGSALGLLVFAAVMLHKLPEGFTMASIMLASGRPRGVALGAAVALGVATILGVASVAAVSGFAGHALALSAGVTIYVAASDLMPEVNKEEGVGMAVVVFAGVALFYVMKLLLDAAGLE